MRILSGTADLETKLFVHYQLFFSVIFYGIIQGEGGLSGRDRIFKMQKIILRLMTGVSYMTSCKGVFKKLYISLYIFKIIKFAHLNKDIY